MLLVAGTRERREKWRHFSGENESKEKNLKTCLHKSLITFYDVSIIKKGKGGEGMCLRGAGWGGCSGVPKAKELREKLQFKSGRPDERFS